MPEILQKGDRILRQIAIEVPGEEIKSSKIRKLLQEMSKALLSQKDGVALAAPQIGRPLRIFIVSAEKIPGVKENSVFINPQIIKSSKEKKYMMEGCLSARHLYGEIKRADKIVIQAYDERGKLFRRGASGLLAQIFQHECDHLGGVLFTDKARNLKKDENFAK